MVKYLVEQCEAKFDESACLWASLLGNIKALRYLREVKNCPWNKVDCMRAAYGCKTLTNEERFANGSRNNRIILAFDF